MHSEIALVDRLPSVAAVMQESTRAAWARTRLQVLSEPYLLVSLPYSSLAQAAQALADSTRSGAHFAAIVIEPDEVSLTIAEGAWQHLAASMAYTAVAGPYHVITFAPALDLTICGYLAPAAVLLAEAGVSIVPQCAYQKDHLLLHMADTIRGVAILESLITSCRLPAEDIARTTTHALLAHQPINPDTLSIRPALLQDAAPLSELAARTFSETFGPHTPPADLAAYLTATYSPEQQAAEIVDSARTVLVVETRTIHGDPALVGYAYLFRSPAPTVVAGPAPLQLERFYLDSQCHGRGAAQKLMAEVLRVATAQGARTLWLGVWERNSRALAFYRKYGFQRVGEHVFPVGTDPQIDWLLARPLNTLAGGTF